MILPIWTTRLFSRDPLGGILFTFVRNCVYKKSSVLWRESLETSGSFLLWNEEQWLELLSKKVVVGGVFEVFLMISVSVPA